MTRITLAALILLTASPALAGRVAYRKPASTYCAACQAAWIAAQNAAASTTYVESPTVASPVIEGGQVVGQ